MCYCPTPTLYLNLALTGDCAFQLSPKKPHSVWFISVLKSGDMGQCPEKSPSPCNTCVIPVSLYKSMSWFVTKTRTHTHTHTHTHTLTHSHTHTLSHTHTHTHTLSHTHTHWGGIRGCCFLCGGSRRIHSLWRLHDARRHSMCPGTRTDPAGAFGASGVLDPPGLPGALCVWWPACGPVRWTRSPQIPNGTPADHPPAHPVQQPHPWFTRARAQLPVRPHVSGLQQ